MIAVWLHVAPEREDEFNAWYELEHIRQIVDLDGFHSGTRYFNDGAFPKFLALYETKDDTVEASAGFQHVTTHPSPWSGRIWSFFGKDRIRLNLRLLATASRDDALTTENHAGTAVVLRHTRRAAGLSLVQAQAEAAEALELSGCRRYRVFQDTHDESIYLEIFDFATSVQATEQTFSRFLARPARQLLDEGAGDVQHVAYEATGKPYVRAER
jgi:quinol monooxygenase YgiN